MKLKYKFLVIIYLNTNLIKKINEIIKFKSIKNINKHNEDKNNKYIN